MLGEIIPNKTCPVCGGPMVHKQNQRGPFASCARYSMTGCKGADWQWRPYGAPSQGGTAPQGGAPSAKGAVYGVLKDSRFASSCARCHQAIAVGQRYYHESKGVTVCLACLGPSVASIPTDPRAQTQAWENRTLPVVATPQQAASIHEAVTAAAPIQQVFPGVGLTVTTPVAVARVPTVIIPPTQMRGPVEIDVTLSLLRCAHDVLGLGGGVTPGSDKEKAMGHILAAWQVLDPIPFDKGA